MLVTRRTLGVAALLTDKLQSLGFSVWTVGKEVLGTSNGFFLWPSKRKKKSCVCIM